MPHSVTLLVLILLLILGQRVYARLTSKRIPTSKMPTVGKRPGASGHTNHHERGNEGCRAMEKGYYQYLKNGIPFMLPNWLHGPDLMMPPSQTRWMLEQPDHVLSAREQLRAVFATDYTIPFMPNPAHEDLIRRNLTRELPSLTAAIMDEVGLAFDKLWGTEQSHFLDLSVFDTMVNAVARVSNRVFVGTSLCKVNPVQRSLCYIDREKGRNEAYLKSVVNFTHDVAIGGALINTLPHLLRPILGPLIAIPNRYHCWRSTRHTLPLIQQRMADIPRKATEIEFKFDPPNDFTTWAIQDPRNGPDPRDCSAKGLSYRLIVVNFPTIRTSSLTMTNALFDLASSPPEKGFLSGLREEIEKVLSDEQGQWTKAGLNKMIRVDSAIRESMRYSGFFSRGLLRKVVAKDGIILKNGVHLQPGSKVGVAAYSVHHDEANYDSPYVYDAFRFSRSRENAGTSSRGNKMNMAMVLQHTKNLALSSTSETFMAFGHGRHACPGRYFAADVMKLMVAYIILSYDIEPLEKRPPNKWVLETIMPPMKAKLRVRRRKV